MMLNIILFLYLPLHTFSGEISLHVSYPFINWIVCFLLLCFKSSLYVLDISPLLHTQFSNFFSPSVACLFVLLTVFHEVKVLILMKSKFYFYGSYLWYKVIGNIFLHGNKHPLPHFPCPNHWHIL